MGLRALSAADVALEPLEAYKSHGLYPRAASEVLATKRREGVNAAREHARRIAQVMEDLDLERYLG